MWQEGKVLVSRAFGHGRWETAKPVNAGAGTGAGEAVFVVLSPHGVGIAAPRGRGARTR